MKNLLLVGDSIRAGYDKSVKKTLEGKVNVIFPEDNCRFASYILRYFNDYLCGVKGEDIDVVHWNTGLWDCLRMFGEEPHTPIDIYEYYIDRICKRIKNTCPNATVIFATTTPLRKEHKKSEKHNANVIRFNSIITPLLEEKGIIINDLHKLVSTDVEKYILPTDNIHLSEAGGEVCAKQVVDVIKTVAKTLCDDARKVKCETSQDKMGVPV